MATKNKPKLYFDTNCFIDLIKNKLDIRLSEDDQAGRLEQVLYCRSILIASKKGDIEVYTSTITLAECVSAGEGQPATDKARKLITTMLTSGLSGIRLTQCSYYVAYMARDLLWNSKINIKPMDRLHLASAIEANCDEYITVDNKDFTEKNKEKIEALGIRSINPSQTAFLPEEYRQGMFEGMEQE